VSPTKDVIRFNIKGGLSLWYIKTVMIVARVAKLVYWLELPESMKVVHIVFHVPMLRKHFRDPVRQITMKPIKREQDLTFEVCPVMILEKSERKMSNRTLNYVRVLWVQQTECEATWELESRKCRSIQKCSWLVYNAWLYV
jgi:hypothetical protein